MRVSLASLALVLALAGCGSQERDSKELETFDAAEPAPPQTTESTAAAPQAVSTRAPDVAPTAAPGVAFNYRHAFALAPERIAEVQERHAAACEALGVSRCRITGMNYRRRNEHDIEARLQFKLEPSLARAFGRSGLQVVQEAEGMLVESEISGTDVGTGIRANTRSIEQLREDLARVERQLADPSVPASRKETLRYEAEQIRQRIRAIETTREDQQESLATTPVTFAYSTHEDLGERPNWERSLANAKDGFVWGLYGLFVVLVSLLPWMVLAGLAFLLVRWARRRLAWRRDQVATTTDAGPPPAV